MTSLPTVVVVDDAAEIRTLVRTRLRVSNSLDVVAEGASGHDAVALAEQHRPALLLLDVSMPGMDGLEALQRVRERSPETRVVMYSGFSELGLAERTLQLGAAAFFEKSTSLDTLVDDLLGVLDGSEGVRCSPEPGQVEPVLEEHLERFRELFEDAAIGMATLTLSGRVVRVNRSLAALLGRPDKEIVSTEYSEFVADDGGLMAHALDEVVRRSRDAVQIEHAVIGRDHRRLLATLSPVRDSRRSPLYLFLQVQDVSAQRAAEEELRRSEERLGLLVDAVEDYAIFMLDPDGRVASWNAGAERIKGWTAGEIIGEHFRRFYPAEQQQRRHPEHELEVALRRGSYCEEGVRVRKDGSTFWANVTITAVFERSGRHIGFGKVTRDVTEQRAAAEALRQGEQRFRLLVEAVQDYAIFMLDPDGRISSWNAGAQRSKGYAAGDVIGRHFRMFYPVGKQAERHPEHELELALRDGRYEEEDWRVRKDGSMFWAHVTITAVRDRDDNLVGFAKVTRDTTERLLLQHEQARSAAALAGANTNLESANARLQQIAEDQSHLLAVAAHELRSPVGVLSGTADMLGDHWDQLEPDERADLLAGMKPSADRLRRLLGDLLTASRIQAGALDLDVRTLDVRKQLEAVAMTTRRASGLDQVVVKAQPGLAVAADAGRLAQMVENLVGNALRHGTPPVVLSAEDGPTTVDIVVSDAGQGVPAELQGRLFERFVTTSAGGTGLGLFIVRELARTQGGDASYRPTDGAFVITLPAAGSES
jgi:PAS domain S-box-containing protein